MCALTNIKNEGYYLLERWHFTFTLTNGNSGTRTYLDTDKVLDGSEKVNLPSVGDPWDDDNLDVICVKLDLDYFSGEGCGKKILATYAPEFITMDSTPSSLEDLPKYVDVGANIRWWTPDKAAYLWSETLTPVKQPLSVIESIITIRVYRIIKSFNAYMQVITASAQKTNAERQFGYPIGMVLFEAGNLSEFRNRAGEKRWTVELVFVVRSVTGVNEDGLDGWNFVYRKDTAEWDKPITAVGSKLLYQSTSFEELYTSDPLGDDELKAEKFPDQ